MRRSDPAARSVGLIRETGRQTDVRRTLPYPADTVWDLLMADSGRTHWLGPNAALPTVPKTAYQTSNGTTGELGSYTAGQLIRLTGE